MVLANRAKLQNSRSLVRVFGGLNETYACSEAEYSAGVNFSARDFPALSTRKPRRKLRELTGLNGMYHLNGLLTVCGKDLIYTPDADGANPVTCTEAVTDGKKALVGIGTKILIFPDKVAFDTADGSVSALGAVWQAEGQSVQFAPCDAAGKAYEVSGYGKEEPEKPAQIRTADGAMISVTTQITGILRGLLRSSYPVTPGFKVADIDPRKEELSNCFLISDKARCIAGSVLELVCAQLWK